MLKSTLIPTRLLSEEEDSSSFEGVTPVGERQIEYLNRPIDHIPSVHLSNRLLGQRDYYTSIDLHFNQGNSG